MFRVIFTGIRKTNSLVSRSGRVTKESRPLSVPHTDSHAASAAGGGTPGFSRFSKLKFQHDFIWESGCFTRLFLLTIMSGGFGLLYQAGRLAQRDYNVQKEKNSFVCGAIVVSSCTGSNVSAPDTLMFEKVNNDIHKSSFCGWHHPHGWWVMEKSWKNV